VKRRVFFYLRLGVSLLLIGFFVSTIDFREAFRPIRPLGWFYIIMALVLANVDRALMGYKWNILLRIKGIALPFGDVLASYYVGTFWGQFLPMTLGGDVVRAYRVSGQIGSKADIVSSIVLERLLGVVSSLLVGLLSVGLFLVLVSAADWKVAVILVVSCLVCVAIIYLSFTNWLKEWLDRGFLLRRKGWVQGAIRVYHSYKSYQSHRGPMLRFLAWSVVEQWFPILCSYLVSQALDLDVPFWSFVVFIPVILSLARIPIALNGFGVTEGLFVYFFSFAGMATGDAFMIGFLGHILGILAVLPGFLYCSFYLPSLESRETVYRENAGLFDDVATPSKTE